MKINENSIYNRVVAEDWGNDIQKLDALIFIFIEDEMLTQANAKPNRLMDMDVLEDIADKALLRIKKRVLEAQEKRQSEILGGGVVTQ